MLFRSNQPSTSSNTEDSMNAKRFANKSFTEIWIGGFQSRHRSEQALLRFLSEILNTEISNPLRTSNGSFIINIPSANLERILKMNGTRHPEFPQGILLAISKRTALPRPTKQQSPPTANTTTQGKQLTDKTAAVFIADDAKCRNATRQVSRDAPNAKILRADEQSATSLTNQPNKCRRTLALPDSSLPEPSGGTSPRASPTSQDNTGPDHALSKQSSAACSQDRPTNEKDIITAERASKAGRCKSATPGRRRNPNAEIATEPEQRPQLPENSRDSPDAAASAGSKTRRQIGRAHV